MRSMTVQIGFTISNRRSTVIASEPLDTERVNWTAIRENVGQASIFGNAA